MLTDAYQDKKNHENIDWAFLVYEVALKFSIWVL